MARLRRSEILFNGCVAHKTWHSHHRDFNIEHPEDKEKYLKTLFSKITPQAGFLNSFSLMSNHVHEVYEIRSVSRFSEFMRIHHTIYGQYFNKKYSRKGKVANDRPYTKLIQNDQHEMISTLYTHANPIKDGLVKNIKDFEWSSHLLYSEGVDQFSAGKLVLPKWYVELGSTNLIRQKNYNEIFEFYVENYIVNRDDKKCASPIWA